MIWRVKNGRIVIFWSNNWLSLIEPFINHPLFLVDVDQINACVSDFVINNSD